ncbi:MAG: helicase-exonuclease AddAB subunit AddA [Lachnospirales bacterium]
MAEIKLSKNQKLAVETRDKNILVSAGAGAGKTFVLVKRILKMITEEGIDIDSLLIVTFSRAAAGEMRNRIGKAIKKELDKNPKDKNLQRQALLLNKANISTIDAFCGNIVKNNFYKTDIDPGYRILSDTDEMNKLKSEAIDILFNKKYEENDSNFLALINAYCNEFKDDKLVGIIYDIYDKATDDPYPDKWLRMCRDNYDIEKYGSFYETPLGKFTAEKILDNVESVRYYYNKAKRYTYFDENYLEPLENFLNIFNTYSLEDITEDMFNIKSNKIKFEDNSKSFEEFFNCVKQAIKYMNNATIFFYNRRNIEYILEKQKPFVNTLIDLITEFSEIYKGLKLERKCAEFNDIQHYVLSILRDENGNPSEVANSLREKYKEIIIDEYQDSNNLQEAIFTSFSRGNNMFMVGDIKQSIYRFRQANPELFKYKYDNFPKDKNSMLIHLSENYRSKSCIIDFCNHIFSQIMTSEFGEVDYDEDAKLKSTDEHPEIYNKTDLHILEKPSDLPEELIGFSDIEYESEFIAEKIKELLEENPNIKPSDIAVLSRKRDKIFDKLLYSLTKRGIPASTENKSSLSSTLEIQTIISLLKLIDNPYDNIPVITILHSQIYNFNDEDILKIKLFTNDPLIFICINKYVESNDDEISKKLNLFLNDLENFRNFALNNSLSRLISYIYDITGYYTYVNILPNGSQRQANLTLLTEVAENFEKYNTNDLKAFIDYVETSGNINEATNNTESKSTVKLLTMHASKGLEFPVVFISFTGARILRPRYYPIIHHKLGFALKYIKDEHHTLDSPVGNILKSQLNEEDLSEALRLLYVAITRAKEKLVITGVVSAKDFEKLQNIDSIDPKLACSTSSNYLSWIYYCLKGEKFEGANINFIPWKGEIPGYKNLSDNSEMLLERIKSIDTKSDYDGKLYEIKNELDYTYHNKLAQKLPTKASISEIKRMYTNIDNESDNIFKEIDFKYPDFEEKSSLDLSGAERGTIYHLVFEHLDFLKVKTKEDIINSIDNMVKSNILKQKEADIVNTDKILAFVNSNLYKRMEKAKGIYKETNFMMSMKGKDIYGDEFKDVDSDIVVRGIIDLYFVEDDHIILVDYKTDVVKNHNVSELKDKYKIQLELYKKALEKNTGMPVSECIIYSVYEDFELLL